MTKRASRVTSPLLPSSVVLVVAFGAGLGLAGCGSDARGGAATSSVCPPTASQADFPGVPGIPGLPGSSGTGTTAGGGGITQVSAFGDNPGGLNMWVHAPPGGKASAIVVAMHGCTQGASDYVGAGWNDLADKAGFAVVYPEQTTANNFQKCFRWYDEAQITRDGGEAASIAAMVTYAKKQYGGEHAYVTGLSAGAAMTAVMLATYSDVFEAGAIMSGIAYACATSEIDAFSCLNPGKDQTPEAWAALLPASAKASPPRVSVWQGDMDTTVRPMNELQIARQFAGAAGVSTDSPTTTMVEGVTHAEYKDTSGVVRVETWLVAGMPHGVALAPKAGCGTAGAYMLDEGLCSTMKAAQFFGLVAADGTPTSPAAGATSSSSSSDGSTTGGCP